MPHLDVEQGPQAVAFTPRDPAAGDELVGLPDRSFGAVPRRRATVVPCPAAQALSACTAAAGLNAVAGVDISNEVTVPVGSDGKITLYNNAGSIDLVADLVGYQTD